MENIPESLKINDNDLLVCFNNIEAHVTKIWNPPLLQHYTRHGIDHSQRIIDRLGDLLQEHNDLLNDQERFILLAAIYLHDIGMQSPIDAGLPEKEQYTLKDSEIVREKHSETSASIIRKGKLPLGLDLCRDYSDFIAILSEYHRKLNINDLTMRSIAGKDIRLNLLAALLRLGDELDLDFRRVDINILKMRQIPVESKFHWFSHYYIQSVQIKKGKIKLWFRFPEKYRKEKQLVNVFCKKIYESVKKQFLEVYDILDEYGLRLYRDINVEKENFSSEGELELIPDDLNNYINKKVIKTLEISQKLNKQTNVSWNIDGVLYSDDSEIANCLNNIFRLLSEDKYTEAVKVVTRCNILTMAPKERFEFSIVAGNCYLLSGKPNEAKIYFENVLELSKSIKLQKIYGKTVFSVKSAALGSLGILHREQGDFKSSVLCLNEALTISNEIGDKIGEAVQLGHLGILYMDKGNLDEAMNYLKKSLKIIKKMNFKEGLANNLGNIGIIYKYKGELDTALSYFNKALNINKEIKNLRSEAINLAAIGGIYQDKGDLNKALDYYVESFQINKKTGYKIGIGTDLGNIGIVYRYKGDLDTALKYFNEALNINKEIGYKIGEASNLSNIGLVYKNKDVRLAIKYLEDSLDINKQIEYIRGISTDLENIGLLYASLNNYENAIKYLEESLDINKEKDYVIREANTLSNMGIIYVDMGNFKKAFDKLNEALTINRRLKLKQSEAINLEYIGILYIRKGQLKDALKFLNEALDINMKIEYKIGEASVLMNIGLVYGQENPDKAIKCLKKALNMKINDNNLKSQILNNIALMYSQNGEYKEVFNNLALSISLSYPPLDTLEVLLQVIKKLIDGAEWKNLKNIEIMYQSELIKDEMLIKLLMVIYEYSLIQSEGNNLDNYKKLYNELGPMSKTVIDNLLEVKID